GVYGCGQGLNSLIGHASASTFTSGQYAAPSTSATNSSTASSDSLLTSASLYTASPTTTPTSSHASKTRIAAPSSLTAKAQNTSQITLNWKYTSSNKTSGFKVYRSTDDVTFSQLTTVGVTARSYTDTGLAAGTKYYYK